MSKSGKYLKYNSLYGAVVVVIFWYILHFTVSTRIIPSPYETITVFVKLLGKGLLIHLTVSFLRIAASILISLGIGVPLGLWIGVSKRADTIISPVAYILYPIPKIAFLPVFMLLFGLGDTSKIVLIITIIVFQILLAARDGVKEISTQLFYSVKSLGLGKWQTYTNLVFPAVLPKIISSLRISIGVSIAVLFFGENYATTYGIGYFIMNAWSMIRYVDMFAGILGLSLLGLLIFKLIDLAERRLCPWIFISDYDK